VANKVLGIEFFATKRREKTQEGMIGTGQKYKKYTRVYFNSSSGQVPRFFQFEEYDVTAKFGVR
jgi:hypothetical protein